MTKLKLFSIAALLSAAITSPVLAQQAVQEPGAAAFYQSLGVGSHNYPLTPAISICRWSRRRSSAMCAVRRGIDMAVRGGLAVPSAVAYWRRPKRSPARLSR